MAVTWTPGIPPEVWKLLEQDGVPAYLKYNGTPLVERLLQEQNADAERITRLLVMDFVHWLKWYTPKHGWVVPKE